ncbi:MAG: aldo/keto reductase [Deltaproteobacteria bacterium]|jgi:aryl-alcohol dehydrogenase-like predicted oxidoreductase|nr:aldo/keto reductase [Deltaproteobacteria bacterium]MBW2530596.1 aldo/keto reductase [Deltaproteobacteria bacterium]
MSSAAPDDGGAWDLSRRVRLGSTSLSVSRLGLGASYGVSRRACHQAFDAGVNYWFWGSTRTRGMALAIRDLAPGHRDELVVVLQCYPRFASWLRRSIDKGLDTLGLDYADVMLLGWHDRHPSRKLLDAALVERDRGRFRYLAISSHQRPLFRSYLDDGLYDIFHLRYNAAHPGAEQDVFPFLPAEGRPGIVAFTCTRWGHLLDPKKMPRGEAPLSAADCYRFVLADPNVDVAICGPATDEQMTHALSALRSARPDEDELARMRAIGHHVHEQRSLSDWIL